MGVGTGVVATGTTIGVVVGGVVAGKVDPLGWDEPVVVVCVPSQEVPVELLPGQLYQ